MVVLELMPHDEQWVRTRLGHQHLGFEPGVLQAAMRAAGLETPTLVPAPRDATSPFKAFLLTGTRPLEHALPASSAHRSNTLAPRAP